ncbi:MAG: hypothetical protein KDK08_28570 [Rhizobiaceae bacterium]|nr:hypothetical protein [Rhizobiaceae bacterium]
MRPTGSPFRDDDEQRLDLYFTKKLKAQRFNPADSVGESEWDIFRTSLGSCWDHLGGTTPQRRQDGIAFRLAAGFVDMASPSAFATAEDGTHLIGVHTGLAASMLEISLFFYSQASFFPEVGDPSRERSPALGSDSALSMTVVDLVRQANQSGIRSYGEMITPIDGTRYLHAQLMALLLLRFAWYHEFYHCVNGHVGLVHDLGLASALCQIGDDAHGVPATFPKEAMPQLSAQEVMHCLELDADRSALWASAKIQLSGDENIVGLARLDLRHRMKMVLFSSFLITHFFAEHNRRSSVPSLLHPRPELRLHNLVRTIASNLLDDYPQTRHLFAEVLDEFTSLERAVPGLMRTSDLLRDFRSEEFQARLEKTERKLELLRQATLPFNYVQ